MPLSEHEQRLLEQIEQALYADDPKFASAVRSAKATSHTRRHLIYCVLGVLAGLAIVLAGLASKIIQIGVVGFVIIVGACGYAATLLKSRPSSSPSIESTSRPRGSSNRGIRSKMEDRLRRRFDEE